MAGFETHRRRVHDADLPVRARHNALRTCVVGFAPYGFRATYHHLCRSARIPVVLEDDPAALVRAVEELRSARRLRLADEAAYVTRRRREKDLGRRVPRPDGGWRDQRPGPEGSLAFCPDSEFHPCEPLPTVVGRVLASAIPPGTDSPRCRACGSDAKTCSWKSGLHVYRLCARCGVSLGSRPSDVDRRRLAARSLRWKELWKRAA
ncbi:hypothetical protein ABZ479_22310 [Streptomyces sp. NPDC005722]